LIRINNSKTKNLEIVLYKIPQNKMIIFEK